MSSKLDFTMTIPKNYSSGFLSAPTIGNQAHIVSSRIASDSLETGQHSDVKMLDCLSGTWNKIVKCLQKIWNFVYCKRDNIPSSQRSDPSVWQEKMTVNLKNPNSPGLSFVDLSGTIATPGTCEALLLSRIPQIGHYGQNYPILTPLIAVKLPASQLERFPEAIKNELSSYAADHLDLYFLIWNDIPRVLEGADQVGKRNLIYHPMAYPDAQRGQTHNQNLSMGIFDAEGIEMARGSPSQAMPMNRFGEQNVHLHPRGQQMCISPDHSRFYLPANRTWSTFNSACKLPGQRAVAVFGVIIKNNLFIPEYNVLAEPLYRDRINLQEYKAGIQNSQLDPRLVAKISHVLDFPS